MKKIATLMSIYMGIIMSLVLSLVGTLTSGHFTMISWMISFGISLVISLLIGFLVPVKRIGDAACKACSVEPLSMKGNALSSLVSDVIYTPLITVIMVVVMLKMAAAHAPEGAQIPTVGYVLPASLIICLIVGYIVIAIMQPVLINALMKKYKK